MPLPWKTTAQRDTYANSLASSNHPVYIYIKSSYCIFEIQTPKLNLKRQQHGSHTYTEYRTELTHVNFAYWLLFFGMIQTHFTGLIFCQNRHVGNEGTRENPKTNPPDRRRYLIHVTGKIKSSCLHKHRRISTSWRCINLNHCLFVGV